MSLPHAILGILATGPRHGHAVARALARLFDGIRPVNAGQVYATLGRLTRQQMLTAVPTEADHPHASRVRPYALLPGGRRALRRWLERAQLAPPARCGFVERLVVLHALRDADGLARLVAARRVRLAALRASLDAGDRPRRDRAADRGRSADVPQLLRETARRLVASELAWLADLERTLAPGRRTSAETWSACDA